MTRAQIESRVRTLLKEPTEVWYENTELREWTLEGMEWMATFLPLMYLSDCVQQEFVNTSAEQQEINCSAFARFIKVASVRCTYTTGGTYVDASLILADDVWTIENIAIMAPATTMPVYLIRSADTIKIWPEWGVSASSGCEVNFVQAPAALADDSAVPPFPTHTQDILPYFVASRAKLKDEEWDESAKLMAVARQLLKDLGGTISDSPKQEGK